MQEFRPADVIDQDTRLAESLIDGDVDALDTLVARYGRAVDAVIAASPGANHPDRSIDVFATAWSQRTNIAPGSDFAPWLGGLAAAAVGRDAAEIEQTWAVAMAVDAVDADTRPTLRAYHVDGAELPDDAARHELRLRRRLAHVGDEAHVAEMLADPLSWSDPDRNLTDRVRERVDAENARGDAESGHLADPDHTLDDDVLAEPPSRVARSLRPVLLGLAGAVTVLFVAIVALSAASGSPEPVAFTAELTPTGAIRDVEGGELAVTERDSGLRLDLDAPTLPRRAGDQFYEGVLVLEDGTEITVGTFNDGFDITLSGGVALDRVEQFLVVAREQGADGADVILKLDLPQS